MWSRARVITIVLMLVFITGVLVGCGGTTEPDVSNPSASGSGEPTTNAPADIALTIEGANKVELTMDQLKALPAVTQKATLVKKSGEELINDYKGVALATLLEQAGTKEFADLEVTAADGFVEVLPRDIAADPKAILAYEVDGAAIGKDGPLRLVLEGQSSQYWVKQVVSIKVK